MTTPSDKEAKLCDKLADAVQARMSPEIQALTAKMAELEVTVNAVTGRLDVIDSTISSGTAPKRAIRGAAPKTAGAKKVAGKAGDKAEEDKVTNSLLYFRYAMRHDLEGLREKYGSDENVEAARATETAMAKLNKDTNAGDWWSIVGKFVWSTFAQKEKDDFTPLFKAWKEARDRNNAEPPLDEDADGAAADT